MKFTELKKLLGNKYKISEIKNSIEKIKPIDLKRRLRTKSKKENLIIKILKSKLS